MRPFIDSLWLLGVGLIILSGALFAWPLHMTAGQNSDFLLGLFSFNYLLCLLYGALLLITGVVKFRWRINRNSLSHTLLWLVLLLISAYSLNRQLPIFQISAGWLSIYLVVASCGCIAYGFHQALPRYLQYVIFFVLAAAVVLFFYLALYLLPWYVLSIMASFFLGISLHTFVPLLFVLYLVVVLYRAGSQGRGFQVSIGLGVLLPLLFVTYFTVRWWSIVQQTATAQQTFFSAPENRLPLWVAVSQGLQDDWVTERVIKADVVYDTFSGEGSFWWNTDLRSFDDVRQHDPLVIIASYFQKGPLLDINDRIKILEVLFDSRHQAQERLWSGKDLETAHITTQARIYPDYRLAYTEKTLTVRNTSLHRGGRNQQEAIYTFHLPEGAAVTSLSLWINGKEEPGYLTTKSKADSAYRTIVGVESRDPSVVHWQEGSTVSVRVFPCTPTENRRFKIGITAPLRKEGDSLVYENIYFQGPNFTDTREDVQVTFEKPASQLVLPVSFTNALPQRYQYSGHYKSSWEIRCAATPLATGTYSFGGHTYQVTENRLVTETFEPKQIYLDLDASWTEAEWEAVWEGVKAYPVFAFSGELIPVTEATHQQVFKQLSGRKFSLFPLHLIPKPEAALLITKGNTATPHVSDLKGSGFYDGTMRFLAAKKPIRTFQLASHLTPYLRTLQEFRALKVYQGNEQALRELLRQKQFISTREEANTVEIGQAQLQITEIAGEAANTAPDHLLRLYAYNDILRKIGGDYTRPEAIREDLVQAAQQAYVVTPLSSLVVLETQQDYERFDITNSKDSLKNASVHASGAVPEPHEWMLILLTVCIMASYLIKSYWLK